MVCSRIRAAFEGQGVFVILYLIHESHFLIKDGINIVHGEDLAFNCVFGGVLNGDAATDFLPTSAGASFILVLVTVDSMVLYVANFFFHAGCHLG